MLVISYLFSAISFPTLFRWLQVYPYSTTFYVHNKHPRQPSSMLADACMVQDDGITRLKDQAFIQKIFLVARTDA